MSNITEQQKVQKLYNEIGKRGLYVSSNFDVFTEKPDEIPLAMGAGYKVNLVQPGSNSYASPLLFATLTSLLNHGTMLITGAPGIGKTTGAEFAGHFFTNTPLDEILPEDTKLSEEQSRASQEIADLFKEDFFNKARWKGNIKKFTRNIIPFLEEESKDKSTTLDDNASNLPKTLDEKTAQELAKRLSEIGSNGLPTNPSGLKEFKEIMAGYGQGDPKKASIAFYDRLSDSYDVRFATRPFGRPRVNPFQPVKWTPSMDVSKLDVDYSVQVGGRIIPGVNTYSWNTRRRKAFGGLEEVVPNMDLYLDSSGSMPNPIEQISLPVLAGFVVAKKAHRRGASIRSTNFSGQGQYKTQESTRDLDKIFENLVIHYNGGTVFPTDALLEGRDPRQVLVITDTFVANEQDSSQAIKDLRKRHKGNKVAIYALHPVANSEYLRSAGSEVIHGTTTDIFKRVIGKADEVYKK